MRSPTWVTGFERRRRNLPHWEEPGATYFARFGLTGPSVDLTQPAVGEIIVEALHHFDGIKYWLYDYTVMPHHVHVILKPIVSDGRTERLGSIMGSLKKWTARRINELLGWKGPRWQSETYNHIIRDRAEYEACAEYILHNPRMAGLIDQPTEWPWWGKGRGE